jgi:hypothetical protein
MSKSVCSSREANPLVDDVEAEILADLYSAHRNQTEKSEIQKIIPLGA